MWWEWGYETEDGERAVLGDGWFATVAEAWATSVKACLQEGRSKPWVRLKW